VGKWLFISEHVALFGGMRMSSSGLYNIELSSAAESDLRTPADDISRIRFSLRRLLQRVVMHGSPLSNPPPKRGADIDPTFRFR
jgi:hypothetical protein